MENCNYISRYATLRDGKEITRRWRREEGDRQVVPIIDSLFCVNRTESERRRNLSWRGKPLIERFLPRWTTNHFDVRALLFSVESDESGKRIGGPRCRRCVKVRADPAERSGEYLLISKTAPPPSLSFSVSLLFSPHPPERKHRATRVQDEGGEEERRGSRIAAGFGALRGEFLSPPEH